MNLLHTRITWLALILTGCSPSYAQWQQIGADQLPDPLAISEMRARDTGGLSLGEDGGTLGIFIEEGGEVGIGTSDPRSTLDVAGSVLLPIGSVLAHNLYYDSGWRHKTNGYGLYIQGHGTDGRFSFSASTSGLAGQPASINERFAILNNGTLRLYNDSSLTIRPDTTGNRFEFGTLADPDRLVFDTDDGLLSGIGSVDFEGSGSFGGDGHTLSIFSCMSDCESTSNIEFDALSDSVHPSATGEEVLVACACPIRTAGTRLVSVTVWFTLGSAGENVNVSLRTTDAAAGFSPTDLAGFGGSDYTAGSGLVSEGGEVYSRTESLDFTFATRDKIWAVIELEAQDSPEACALHAIEWVFAERTY
jgi:hypothetical protein